MQLFDFHIFTIVHFVLGLSSQEFQHQLHTSHKLIILARGILLRIDNKVREREGGGREPRKESKWNRFIPFVLRFYIRSIVESLAQIHMLRNNNRGYEQLSKLWALATRICLPNQNWSTYFRLKSASYRYPLTGDNNFVIICPVENFKSK